MESDPKKVGKFTTSPRPFREPQSKPPKERNSWNLSVLVTEPQNGGESKLDKYIEELEKKADKDLITLKAQEIAIQEMTKSFEETKAKYAETIGAVQMIKLLSSKFKLSSK
jgi:hypothetical protein